MAKKTDLRDIPSVDNLLHTHTAAELIAQFGRPLTLEAIRYVLTTVRKKVSKEADTIPPSGEMLLRAGKVLSEWTRPTLQPVINATGVILHTNLGRAPLAPEALSIML